MADAADPPPRLVEMTQAMLDLRSDLDRRMSELRLDRTAAEEDWREITKFLIPKRGRYLVQTTARRPRATSRAILDPTGTKAHGRLAAFMQAGITNPALPWLHLGVADDDVADDDEVRNWCAEVTKRTTRVLSEGTFYQSLHQAYQEMGGFGTGAIIMLQDFEDVVRFYPLTIGEFYFALDDRQEVDTLYREYSVTVSQLVQQFGLENCSPDIQSLHASKRLSGQVVVVHAIEPNRNRKPGRLGWEGKAYRGVYYERGQTGYILRIEGFDHRPFLAPRWDALSGEPYGTGPGHEALPDVKSLQAGVRQLREGNQKLVEPPLQGDARWQNQYVGQLPGDVNYIAGLDGNPHAGLRPIFPAPNLSGLAEEIADYRKTIETTFFNDLILAITNKEGVQPMNEMEIQQRRQEQMLQLGPMLERLYNEALAPAVRFVFAEMQRVHLLPNPPDILRGRMVQPRFVSVLAQAQKSVGTSAIEAVVKLVLTVAGIKPDALDKVDLDAVIATYAELVDTPEHIVVDQDKVDQVRAGRAKQQQQQQAMLNVQQAAQAGANASNIDVGGGQNLIQAALNRPGTVAQ